MSVAYHWTLEIKSRCITNSAAILSRCLRIDRTGTIRRNGVTCPLHSSDLTLRTAGGLFIVRTAIPDGTYTTLSNHRAISRHCCTKLTGIRQAFFSGECGGARTYNRRKNGARQVEVEAAPRRYSRLGIAPTAAGAYFIWSGLRRSFLSS